MSIDLTSRVCPSRESRLGSVTGYWGSLQGLGQECRKEGCPGERKRCFTQASGCMSTCALGQLSGINDAAIVQHSPSGCAATAMSVCSNLDLLASALNRERAHFGYTCTDMGESDTVFGATEKLKEVIRETYARYKPKVIFIGASCVSGIIGEDFDGLIDELREEIPVPLAPVHCEGFKSQIWASGFDAAWHAVLKYLVEAPRTKSKKVNIIGFTQGLSWNARADVEELLGVLGLEAVYFPASSTVEEFARSSEATATISTCSTLGAYFGVGLEEAYGVPYIRSVPPHGIAGYSDFARHLAAVAGKEAEMEVHLSKELAYYLPRIEAVKRELAGKRAMVAMGPGFGFNYVRILQELGLQVEHLSAWHFDKAYDDGRAPAAFEYLLSHSPNDFILSVNDLQNYEFMNILQKVHPDVFISRHPGSTVWAMKLGIPAYCIYDEYNAFGYKGMLRFAQTLLYTIVNRSFPENLSRRVRLPYTTWWMEQQADRFLQATEED